MAGRTGGRTPQLHHTGECRRRRWLLPRHRGGLPSRRCLDRVRGRRCNPPPRLPRPADAPPQRPARRHPGSPPTAERPDFHQRFHRLRLFPSVSVGISRQTQAPRHTGSHRDCRHRLRRATHPPQRSGKDRTSQPPSLYLLRRYGLLPARPLGRFPPALRAGCPDGQAPVLLGRQLGTAHPQKALEATLSSAKRHLPQSPLREKLGRAPPARFYLHAGLSSHRPADPPLCESL